MVQKSYPPRFRGSCLSVTLVCTLFAAFTRIKARIFFPNSPIHWCHHFREATHGSSTWFIRVIVTPPRRRGFLCAPLPPRRLTQPNNEGSGDWRASVTSFYFGVNRVMQRDARESGCRAHFPTGGFADFQHMAVKPPGRPFSSESRTQRCVPR